MDTKATTHFSKFLSLVLRHEPQKIGIALDESGWVSVDDLLAAMATHGNPATLEQLRYVVSNNDKKRFAFSDDGAKIRASQGHSVNVELGYHPADPPEMLYHGTVEKFIASIREQGLLKGERHHVHLSADDQLARRVGQRRGRPIVLKIRSREMQSDGYVFLISANNVWLTDHVPTKYLEFPGQ